MAMEYFQCYHSYLKKIAKLSDQEVGRLFRALLKYSATGERQELTGREDIAFDFIADDIDRAKAAYEEKCRVNAEHGRKGGTSKAEKQTPANASERGRTLANGGERYQTPANASERGRTGSNSSESSQGKDEDECKNKHIKERGSEAPPREKRTRFSPPSLDDVRDYCKERGNSVDPELFLDFYTANGWKQGSGKPVKDWRACVRTWERRNAQEAQTAPKEKKNRFRNYEQRDIDYDEALNEIWKNQYGGET